MKIYKNIFCNTCTNAEMRSDIEDIIISILFDYGGDDAKYILRVLINFIIE
jgi:hypothetical protein